MDSRKILRTKMKAFQIVASQMPTWKKYARIVLPHVGLILLSLLYVVGGAVAFYHMEHPNEMAVRESAIRRFNQHKEQMLDELWTLIDSGASPGHLIEARANIYVENSTRILFEAFDTHFISAALLKPGGETEAYSWTFITALFFTATLLTTIGYGNLVPVTWHGRMFCIAYALLGVPLILITVADIGKFLSENIIWLYSRYSKARERCRRRNYSSLPIRDENCREGEQLMPGLEHYISIPVALIVMILLGYMAVGAVLLGSWENWQFFSGFYFSFITMTTIGFGDIVPINREFYVLDLCYIIIGLAITTMCIDLVGIQYIRKIHYFGRAIKDARFALVNVGGKMVHVPDLMRYASVLQQKYGHKKPHSTVIVKGAYAPKDINKISGSLAYDTFLLFELIPHEERTGDQYLLTENGALSIHQSRTIALCCPDRTH
ncbi:Ion channel [Dictyocaulus viviparus]|uniref:Ion channel n=1 Tax=Dictyocaulus viviparus TaxID=29172 RepID=A0A0D8XPM2_DICVI|nr:Ion channel [Dictyocaulus viviparus]